MLEYGFLVWAKSRALLGLYSQMTLVLGAFVFFPRWELYISYDYL